MKKILLHLLCALILPFGFSIAQTFAAPASTAPGTYTNWKGEIDEVQILRPFRADDFRDILVESFDSSHVPMPDKDDNTYAAVRSALATIKPAFIQGLQTHLRARRETGSGRALIVRARLTKMDPGSQAARYFGGFGAGAVKVAIAGELIDRTSGEVLVRFAQERRSGFGWFGGAYSDLFDRTARQIGGDVATLINAF